MTEFYSNRQNIIEFYGSQPNQDIKLTSGASLIEKGRVSSGSDFKSVTGNISLKEYNKMRDPRTQQVADTMKKMQS